MKRLNREDCDVFIGYDFDNASELNSMLAQGLSSKWYAVYRSAPSECVEKCRDYLMILTPGCLNGCMKPSHLMRTQVEKALLKGVNVVPIMVDDFEYPPEMPSSMSALPGKNALRISGARFAGCAGKLISGGYLVSKPRPRIFDKAKISLSISAAVVVLLALLFAFFGRDIVRFIFPAQISGIVSAAGTNAPVAGATVSVSSEIGALTGPDGSYTFKLKGGTYTLSCSADGYEAQQMGIAPEPNGRLAQNITLSTGRGALAGTVVSAADGSAVEGAQISCGEENTVSGAEGAFSLTLPKGSQVLNFSAEGFEDASITVEVLPDQENPLQATLSTGRGLVTGHVTLALDGSPAAGAQVSCGEASAVTGADGLYSLTLPKGTQSIRFAADGLHETVQEAEVIADGQITLDAQLTGSAGSINGTVTNAVDNQPIAGVQVTMDGRNVTTGTDGKFTFPEVNAGEAVLNFAKEGFIEKTETAQVAQDSVSTVDCVLSQELASSEYRVVLSWGSKPKDLDSHLLDSDGMHVCYSHKTSGNVKLDRDDTDCYGPETTTFTLDPAKSYLFYVHDYSHGRSLTSAEMAASGATVEIYRGDELLGRRSMPNRPGIVWQVFRIDHGELSFIDTVNFQRPVGVN